MMNIIKAFPPNIEAIVAVFPKARNSNVIFTYGHDVYVPSGIPLSPELKAHESVHIQQQTTYSPSIQWWWDTYLADAEFRLGEELKAHREEYWKYCAMNRDTNARARFLSMLAARLAGPLYGKILSTTAIRKAISA